MPQVLYLESGQADSSSIELKMPNPFERAFIECAFGPDFEFNSFAAMSELVSEESLEVAQERLSSACRAALPKSLHYQFKLSRVPSEPAKLHVRASDAFGGRIPLQGRGAGAKKLIGLYLSLISFVRDTPCLVLLDEPENSLHADAQRALRGFLDSLGSRDGVQIIYSTHSPVMIDPQRADRVRLVLQRSLNGVAESVIDNKPYSENFRQVRASLGMSTTDTLLYSDVSLIVEGETEIVSLPILLMRLSTLDARFKSVGKWLADIHLINGLGDSFDKLCSVAKGFGVKPAVFLDGDKIKRLRESRFFTKHPDVPVVHLPEGVEIEQMVPMSLYIECVAAVHRLKSEEATKDTFLAWMQGCSDRWIEKLAFSKQVDSWLGAEFAVNLNKVQVMKRAAETVEIGSISHLDCLESVAQKVEELLNAK
ncbi:ATP-dependent nuclease [Lacipirellula sp.]|uniref:ATP-dependent nuclease n=1 Tax=Lacipirellula sp. TaxID=2691419 RepID=UPI003D0D1529